MYFKFACPSCAKNLKVREEDGGRKARCPYCKTTVTVPKFQPSAVPEAKPRAPRSAADELAAAASEASGGAGRSGAHPSPAAARPKSAQAGGASTPAPSRATETSAETSGGGGFTQAGFDGTNVSLLVSALCAVIASGLWYIALYFFQGKYFADLFWDRGWVPVVLVFLMMWSSAILVMKSLKMRRQRDAMLFDLLPTEIAEEITVDDVPKFTRNIRDLPAEAGNSFLINRVLRGLEYFRVRRNNPEVASLLSSQSDIDANAVYSSYAIVKVFTWAIPILGFIGTVIGISDAVGGFGGDMSDAQNIEALKEQLGEVTGGLSVAFDTTLVALVMSLLVSIPTTALRKSEEDLLNGVDEYCNENLLKRLNDDEGQIAAAQGTSAIRKAIEQSLGAHHAELETWTRKLESIGGSLTDEVVKGWTKVFKEIDESQAAASDKQHQQMADLQKAIERITERTGRAERDTAESMKETSDAMRGYFESMREGVDGLNRVLGELGEKQVTIQQTVKKKRGWFGKNGG